MVDISSQGDACSLGRHVSEPALLDLALALERSRPWPLVAPGSPT